MKKVLVVIVTLLTIRANAGTYDTVAAYKFINTVLQQNTKKIDGEQYLIGELYRRFYSTFRKKEICIGLEEYLSPFQIDSLNNECQKISQSFQWKNDNLFLKVIDSSYAKLIIDSVSTTVIVHDKRGKIKRIVQPKKATIFTTSPPLFFNQNYCLLLISSRSGVTIGSTCLILFKKDLHGNWNEEKTISCIMM